jgi:hypothetical protein
MALGIRRIPARLIGTIRIGLSFSGGESCARDALTVAVWQRREDKHESQGSCGTCGNGQLSLAPLPTSNAGVNAIRTAQLDLNLRRTPQPTPNVVIEEPRPPSVTDETEGRAGDRNCHSTIASERRDQAKVIDPERVCDPE